jgi:hypothetical protein
MHPMHQRRKPFGPAASRPALAWLGSEPAFAQLQERVVRLAALQDELRRCVPGVTLNVIALERGVLVVGAAQASAAARVRQFGPSILAALNSRGWKVEQIRFKPQMPKGRGPVRPPKDAVGAGAVASLTELSAKVTDPRLRDALLRLARRHGGT